MKNFSSALLRTLGVLVGSLFVATALITSKVEWTTSFDEAGRLLGLVAMGLIFIAYGVKGNALFSKPPSRLRFFSSLMFNLMLIAMGLRLVADPDRGATIKVAGCILLLSGVCYSWVAYAARRSTPAA